MLESDGRSSATVDDLAEEQWNQGSMWLLAESGAGE